MTNLNKPTAELERINKIKAETYLNYRIWDVLGENMHYEILKYLNWECLYNIRVVNLAGFQLCTNPLMRKRIGNFPCQKLMLDPIATGSEIINLKISIILNFDYIYI